MAYSNHNQSSEDYLESIYLLSSQLPAVHRIDVSKRLLVSSAAVNKAVNLLIQRGLVFEEGKHLCLTEQGKNEAEKIYHRHCVLYDFLSSLGVDKTTAERDACNMEHVISDATFLAIEKKLKKD